MTRIGFGVLACALAMPSLATAADHIDSPAATADPTADITDLFAWMSPDAQKVNLVLNVHFAASETSMFSDAVQYVFHVNSSAGYGMDQQETRVVCTFDSEGTASCWVGASDDYVRGDASTEAGIVSDSGKLRVFAGPRNDPFFMEFAGFTETVAIVKGAAAGLDFDAAGCPALDADTSALLVGQLASGPDGVPASDFFAGGNVLSLVVQVDKDLLTGGGPLLAVWASTHATN